MRRATTITLVVMGGGALTLGTVAVLRRPGPDPACNTVQPAQATPAAASCDSHGGGSGGGGGGSGGRSGGQAGADADSAGRSARGGFGESGGAHGGE